MSDGNDNMESGQNAAHQLEVVVEEKVDNVVQPRVWRQPAKLPNGFEVPTPFELWGDGLYAVDLQALEESGDQAEPSLESTPSPKRRGALELIARRPLWIHQYGRAIDTDDELALLVHFDAILDKKVYTWVDRATLASRQKLVQLSKCGLPITDGNSSAVLAYLDAAYHHNAANLESVTVATKCGPYEREIVDRSERIPKRRNVTGWLIGKTWIGPEENKVALDERATHEFASGLRVNGDEDEWLEFWIRTADHSPVVRWLLNATFAAPLMRILNTRTFIIHHWGTTETGKTAVLKLAESAWGDPQSLTMHFNRTTKSFEALFNYVDGIPIAFDELQSAEKSDLSSLIYMLCLERGRARATKTGGLESEITNWRALVRTTGEEPLIGKDGAVDLGGQVNRVIQLDAALLDSKVARDIHVWLEHGNYGWGAVKFLRFLSGVMREPDGAERIRAVFEEYKRRIRESADGLNVESRIGHLAVVATAEYLANLAFLEHRKESDAFKEALQDSLAVARVLAEEEAVQREPISSQVVEMFRDSFHERRGYWLDFDEAADRRAFINRKYAPGLAGVLAGDEVWLVPTIANKMMRAARLSPRKVLTDLKRSGVLITDETSKGYKTRRGLERNINRFYVLDRAHFDVA